MITNQATVLSREEAAKFLGGICLTTLHRLCIPKIKIRRRTFYRIEDLKSWLIEQMNAGDKK